MIGVNLSCPKYVHTELPHRVGCHSLAKTVPPFARERPNGGLIDLS